MAAEVIRKVFAVFVTLCALNGVLGLLIVVLFLAIRVIKAVTGVDILPMRPGWHLTLGGVLVGVAISLFWLLEIVACWLFLRHFSKLAIYLAVGLLGFWSVCIVDILVFEVFGSGAPVSLAHLPLDLSTLAVISWPCIALGRWLSRAPVAPPVNGEAEPSAKGIAASPRASA